MSESTRGREDVVQCDLCGGELQDHEPVADWGLARCASCGVVATTPRPDRESIGSYYPSEYGPHNEDVRASRSWRLREDVRAAQSGCPGFDTLRWRALAVTLGPLSLLVVPWRRPDEVLVEIGSGGGHNVGWARRGGWRAVGVDPSATAVATGLRNGEPGIVGIGEHLPVRDASVDVVLLNQSLEHTHSPSTTLAEAYRVLAPDGIAVVSVPNFGSRGAYRLERAWQNLQLPKHLWHFDPESLVQAMQAAGFEIGTRRFTNPVISAARNVRQRIKIGPRWIPSRAPVYRETPHARRMGDCMLVIGHKP